MTPALTEADRRTLAARLAARLPARWRTRFAPAPTGRLHMGHAVNAVFVWSIARAFGGSVLLRIEDHDRQRARAEFDDGILSDLAWLGLTADNAALGFPHPLRQRDDMAYANALDGLAHSQHVYACRCSRKVIAAVIEAGGTEARYPGTCRHAQVPDAETSARRVLLDERDVPFDDLRHGAQRQVPATQCGDLLVRDRLGQWTYQFAVVVDDLRQGIDVIIRGDDLLASTGRQLMLAEALGRPAPPIVLHHPLVVHADGTKLSKSAGDTGLAELRSMGWSADAVLGRAAWLGGLQSDPAPLAAASLASLWPAS